MAVAAEFPDVDTLWGLRGPIEGFQHHRGMTHTFLGLPFEAAFLVSIVWAAHRWRLRWGAKQPGVGAISRHLTQAPVRWGVLYGLAVVALLSHLLLDYTNNYGLRPFFPFDRHWYAASIVFIVDPFVLLLLAVGLLAPLLFGLIGSEVGVRRERFRGRGWARAALVGILCWWALRYVEHDRAVQLAMLQSYAYSSPDLATGPLNPEAPPDNAAPTYLSARRVLANPSPVNPFSWSVVTDFGPLYQLTEVDTLHPASVPASGQATFFKPSGSLTVRRAEASPLGRAYLDWSPMPIVTADPFYVGSSAELAGAPLPPGDIAVVFRDPRFMGGWLASRDRSDLSGVVVLNAKGDVIRQELDGRVERPR
jgi:inner membrane protein